MTLAVIPGWPAPNDGTAGRVWVLTWTDELLWQPGLAKVEDDIQKKGHVPMNVREKGVPDMTKKESNRTLAQSAGGTLDNPNYLREQPNLRVNRRHMLKGAGMLLGASGALAALAVPAGATSEDEDADEILGLWRTVVSAPDNSFPAFGAFELWGGGGTFSGSGQPDLTPAALASTAWGTWKRLGERKFRLVARFWTYNPDATPSGFAALDSIFVLSKDGKTYHGEGPTQFFDNNGNALGLPSTTFDDGTRITFP